MIEGGRAYGSRGRGFYVIIQCTDDWPEEYYRSTGQGTVHYYLLRNVMGIEPDAARIACGGFAYLMGDLRFSSISLNSTDQFGAESDGSKYLSDPEEVLVRYCWQQYKMYGPHQRFSIPISIDQLLMY